jgi:D-alanine-D-alanine ligase
MAERAFVPVIHGATEDRPDEVDTLMAAKSVAGTLRSLGYKTQVVRVGLDLTPLVRLAAKRPLAVFNLVEALTADMRMATVVPAMLERLGLAYTGASFDAMTSVASKLRVKQLLSHAGLPTPVWTDRGEGLPGDLKVMVKSVDEHASVGIDERSVVPASEAAAEIARRERRHGGRFFAEAFVDGREFNISLVEGEGGVRILPMPEIVFEGFADDRPKIVDYDAKWNEASYEYHHTPRLFGVEGREPALAAELARVCRGVWNLFAITGYARVDLRVGADGLAQVIDVNTNPCISPDAGLAAAAAAAGMAYPDLIRSIVNAAALRGPRQMPCPAPVEERPKPADPLHAGDGLAA